MKEHNRTVYTLLGLLAIVFWSSTVGLVRSLSTHLGPLTAAAAIYLLAGVVSCIYLFLSSKRRAAFQQLPRKYLLGCGALFVTYMCCLYLAVGLAADDLQSVEVGLVNYMWPGLVMALSVPLLGRKARWWLIPGVLIGFAGIVAAMTQKGGYSFSGIAGRLAESWPAYALAAVAAAAWGFYSNLSRKWAGRSEGNAVPVFILVTGVLILLLRLAFPENSRPLTPRVAGEVVFMAVFSGVLGYAFWDLAMRRGHMSLVAAASYFTPVISTVVACLYLLGKLPGWQLWLGCALVTAGAFISKWAIPEPPPAVRDG